MKTLTFTPPHPIIFISDYDNLDAEMPEYTPGSITSATDTCISVGTIADVDGDVTVTLSQVTPDEILTSYVEVFSGDIDCPNHEVAIINSHDEKLLSAVFDGTLIHVRVFVDDDVHPEKVWVEAQDVDEHAHIML